MKIKTNKIISLLVLLKSLDSIELFLLFSSLNFLLIKSGFSLENSAELTALFLCIKFMLPIISGYIANRFIPIELFYLGANFFNILIYLAIFFINKPISYIALGLLCATLRIQPVTVTNLINELTINHNFLRRKIMIFNYAATNIAALIAFFLSFWLFHIGKIKYIFLLITLTPIVSNLIFSFISYTIEKEDFQTALTNAKGYVSIVTLFIFSGISFIYLFHHKLELKDAIIFIIAIGIAYFLYIMSKDKSLLKTELRAILYLFYYLISIMFFSIMMLDPTVILDLAQKTIHIQNPQLLLLTEPISAILLFWIAYLLLKFFKKSKHHFYVTSLLFFISILLAYGGMQLLGNAHSSKLTHPIYFITYLTIITLGETFISPEGFSLAGRLLPKSVQVYAIGLWSTSIGLGYIGSGYLANYMLKQGIIVRTQRTFSIISHYWIFIAIIILVITLFIETLISNNKLLNKFQKPIKKIFYFEK